MQKSRLPGAALRHYHCCVTDHNKSKDSKRHTKPTASCILSDGRVVELVYDSDAKTTSLAVWNGETWSQEAGVETPGGEQLVPYSPQNNLIANDAVLLAVRAEEYGTQDQLYSSVHEFIGRYTDLSESFSHVAASYVLFTWVYDAFAELPYLRLRGDFGTGKTRALLTIGSLCYKAFFASGASTVSPIFHTLDAFRGTLVLDEGDFRFSDERADIVKILNNGNVRGIPVLRTMMTTQREFNPRAFQVFGPKIVATRSHYEDKALESRFLTEEMGLKKLRRDIPINLPASFKGQAATLRNKLLHFRARNRHCTKLDLSLLDSTLEPRLNQILLPLLSVGLAEEARAALRTMADRAQYTLKNERAQSAEAHVLEVLAELLVDVDRAAITIAEITQKLEERFGSEYDRPITNRWVGGIVRKRLHIFTYKTQGVFAVPATERSKVKALCARYGIEVEAGSEQGT